MYILNFSEVQSAIGGWGEWTGRMSCTKGDVFLKGVEYRAEPQISGDDTAGNSVNMVCTDENVLEGNGGKWGSWTNMASCPFNTAICGIKTKVELPQGGEDDTALNDVEFFCCQLPK